MLSRELGKLGHVDSATPITFPKIIKNRIQLFSPVKSISFLFVLTFCSKMFYLFNDYYARLMSNHITIDHFDQIVFSKRQLSSAVS